MCIVIPYSYGNDMCIVMGVVKTPNIIFQKSDNRVVDSRHLWYGTLQLDILHHPKVILVGFFGRSSGRCAPHNNPYISYGPPRMLVLPLGSLFLRWIHPFLADEPLQLPLPDKSFNLLL